MPFLFCSNGDLNSVDDLKRVTGLDAAGPLNIFNLFFPNGNSYYYRPLGRLTFFWDRDIWGSIASFMHLENIFIHFGSTFLVFFITRRVALLYAIESMLVPLGAGLFFGVHPITTEAVCWISGRFDLLAGFFLLLAVYLLLCELNKARVFLLLLSSIAILAACLAKEVAVFALPGLLWLAWTFPKSETKRSGYGFGRLVSFLAPVIGVGLYFLMRHAATARDSGVKAAFKGVAEVTAATDGFELLDKGRVALKVYGFYLKKLFVPWPLNFGIIEISNWYVGCGVLLVALLVWLFWRRDLIGALGLTAFFVLSPALLVVFGRMAWTPIAERYLYIPAALSMPAISILVYQACFMPGAVWCKGKERYISSVFMLLLAVFFITTAHRSWLWQDNERLFRDTVQKSPNFLPAKAELATALSNKGKTEEARSILAAMQDSQAKNYVVADMNLAGLMLHNEEFDDARNLLLKLYAEHPKKRYEILQLLLKVNDKQLGQVLDPARKLVMQNESLEWLLEQKELKPSPFADYRIGKKQLVLGLEKEAAASFRAALAKAPADAFYRGAAKTMLEKLESQ
ncbi:MAG: hypothetical protein RBR06_10890 [Desulfuromonadaceae bacterium]|nr:hypothetical protein [Desulfuromonadaceae bacterium]